MKKYILFLFLFLVSCCKTLDKTGNIPSKPDSVHSDEHNEVKQDSAVFVTEADSSARPEQDVIKSPAPKETPKPVVKKITKATAKKVKTDTIKQDPQYSEGLIAYKIPSDMVVGLNYSVKIRITKENDKTMLVVGDRKIPISDDKTDLVSVESISVSPIMSASLLSDKGTFQVDTLSTQYQNISEKGYTEWEWNIVPLKGGDDLLKLNVKIRIKEGDKDYYKDIVVFDKKIKVKSNIKFSIITWISEYWEYFIGTILIPLIKWLYDEWKKRREENKNKV